MGFLWYSFRYHDGMSQLFYLGILLIHTPEDDFTVLLYKELRFKLNNFFYVKNTVLYSTLYWLY
jgi:hypothetical protein